MIEISASEATDLAYSNLLAYAKFNWPGYEIARHHVLIAHYLEAIERGEINRLIISMPPRHGKTMLTAQNFIPWYLGRNPSHQIIYATYGFDKAGDVGADVRNAMVDPIYQQVFPNCTIDSATKGKNHLSTIQKGNIFSVGVGGVIVGRGAHLFIIDDPIKGRKDAESETSQKDIRDFFRGTAYTRLMDTNAIIVIMTRWHYWDLAGWLLDEIKHENWHYLCLPAEAEEDDDPIGRMYGDPLWPEKFDSQRLAVTKMTIGTREWNSQYQQRPTPEEGGMINLDWFGRYSWREWSAYVTARRLLKTRDNTRMIVPFGIKKFVISWDTAFKEQEIHDPSAATVWGVSKTGVYMIDVVNKRMGFPDLESSAINLHARYQSISRGPVPVLIEDKASGQSLIQTLKRNTRIPVIPIKPDANKTIRFDEVMPLVEAGQVFLPEQAPWLVPVETQLERFPYDRHDDIADSFSQFLRWQLKPQLVKSKLRFWK